MLNENNGRRPRMDKTSRQGVKTLGSLVWLLFTEIDSERYLKKAKKMKEEGNDGFFDNQEEWADGFCGKW